MNGAIKIRTLVLACLFAHLAMGQATHGKIIYERKTNLFKKFKDSWSREWIKESNRIKIDVFELYFDDSLSAFKPQESDIKEKMGWATSKNTVYHNFRQGTRLTIKEIWGEYLYTQDSLWKRRWKITDSKRTIAGFLCRKAVWQADDTTRIYAWYCNEIAVSTGPESFMGLPGAILGLATEDGGVIYFAKSVELVKPPADQLLPRKTRDKIYTSAALRAKLEKDFGKEKWGKSMIHENFDLW
jgi:GLPGLI family protein